MDKLKEAAKLFRALADLFDDVVEGRMEADPAPARAKTKWVTYRLELAQPIGRPKAQRIIDRLATTPKYRDQLGIIMGQGTASRQAVVAFSLRVTDRNGDGMEMATMAAGKLNERGSDPRARAKVARVEKVG